SRSIAGRCRLRSRSRCSWSGCRNCCRLLRWRNSCSRSSRCRLLRRRNPHPQCRCQFPTEVGVRGKYDDDLADPATHVVTENAADGAVVGFIEHEALRMVGEPHDELLFLLFADSFFGDFFNPELLLALKIRCAQKARLIVTRS